MKPVRPGSSLPAITRSYRPPLDLAEEVSAGRGVAVEQEGQQQLEGDQFPEPLGPRRSSRPWWKVNVSSQ